MGVSEHGDVSSQNWKLNIDTGNLEKKVIQSIKQKVYFRYIRPIYHDLSWNDFRFGLGGTHGNPTWAVTQNPLTYSNLTGI